EGLLVAVERGAHILCRAGFRPVPAAPAHVHPGAELRGQVEIAQHLGEREPAHIPVVGGEPAVPEYRMREQVGRRGGDDQACLIEGGAEAGDPPCPLGVTGAEGEHVIVVEVHAVRAYLGEPAYRALGWHRRPDGRAEHVHALPANGPDAKRESVGGGGCVAICAHGPVLSLLVTTGASPARRPSSLSRRAARRAVRG